LSFAINEKSKNKEEAWIFIKFMISKEMQVPQDLNGFVVNKKADAARRETAGTLYNSGDWSSQGRRIIPLTKEMLNAADRLKSNTGRMMDYDDELSRIIFTEARSFFIGEKSAEACAKDIQKKVEVYLNE
jgi:multiple sugar transport system substrate-binding protein